MRIVCFDPLPMVVGQQAGRDLQGGEHAEITAKVDFYGDIY